MKKLATVAIMGILVLSLAACGTQDSQDGYAQGEQGQNEQNQGGQEQGTSGSGEQDTGTPSYENPVKIVIEYEDESMATGAGEYFFYASYNKPTVSIQGNQKAADRINQFFEQNEDEFEDMIAQTRQEAEEYYTMTSGQTSYMWHSDVSISRADAGVISLIQSEESYFGGAHGNYASVGCNFDTQTGDRLKIEDLSDDPTAFCQLIKTTIIEQCKVSPQRDGFFYPVDSQEFAESIDAMLEYDRWYFTKEGLEVIANPYDIAPYAAGTFTFVIPYEKLDGLLDQYKYHGAFMKTVAYEEVCAIDLNGDGKEETIETVLQRDEYGTIMEIGFDINGGSAGVQIDNSFIDADKAFLEYPMEHYYIVDLDTNDEFLEIAVGDYGMNDYNATYFYRYDGRELQYLGWIPNVLDDSLVEVYGDGIIKGTMRVEMVETGRCHVFYKLEDDKMKLVTQDWYEPDYTYYAEDYLTHDVIQDVTVYMENDIQSEKVILTAGEEDVRFLALDNAEWVKLQTEDGQIYYMHMVQSLVIDSDGQELYVTDVFEDILLAG